MVRELTSLVVGISLLSLFTSSAAAQVPLPRIQPLRPAPLDAKTLEELRRILERVDADFDGRPVGTGITWGGLTLQKVTKATQEQLGLPENEGLIVAAVQAGSVAGQAGVRKDDVLVKINNKSVPADFTEFGKLVKNQDANNPMDLVVVRNGKEESIRGAKMPAVVQAGRRGGIRPPFGRFDFPILPVIPPMRIDPIQANAIENLHLEMTVNGAKIVRKQKGDEFSGEYTRGELKISVAGKLENGIARPTEIRVHDGKDTMNFATLRAVPGKYQQAVQQIMPSALPGTQIFDLLPLLPGFPMDLDFDF